VEIPTARLRLVLETTEDVLARIAAMSPAEQAEVSPDWLASLRASDSALREASPTSPKSASS
jgi:hypothetical protein